MSTSSTATTVPNTGMDRWTTISVLCLAAAYAIWVFCVAYLRLLQYRDTKNTIFRRETSNPLKLAHIPDPGGYEFDFQLPRNRLHEMSPKTQRAFNTVLNQAENFGYFAAAVLANVAIRGPLHGTQEVALLSFAHLCARLVSAFGYVIGISQVRTGGFLVGIITNAGLYALLLEKASMKRY